MLAHRLDFRRGAELVSGFLTWKAVDYTFDYLLYPFVVWKLGPLMGGGIMALASLFFCLFLVRLYDRLGRDWLGIEFVKNLRHYEGNSNFRCGLSWLLSRGDGIAFIVLSVKYDPFVTTAYLRRRAFQRFVFRDWIIFLGSWAVANGVWIFLCYGGVSLFSQMVTNNDAILRPH